MCLEVMFVRNVSPDHHDLHLFKSQSVQSKQR